MRKIDLTEWIQTGAGVSCLSYFNMTDPSEMIKFMPQGTPTAELEEELEKAWKVYNLGISTPKPGELVTDGTRPGLLFARIVGKKSYARAIGQMPDRIPELAREYGAMTRQLHSTDCDTSLFPNIKEFYADLIRRNPYRSDGLKQKAIEIMNELPDGTKCVHGDLHFGNIIRTEKERYFIDLGNFCYGNPLFDFGMMEALLLFGPVTQERFFREFHCSVEQATQFWEESLLEYFGNDTDVKKKREEFRIYRSLRVFTIEAEINERIPEELDEEVFPDFK